MQDVHERAAQIEEKRSVLIFERGGCDGGCAARTITPQLPLMFALMQIADAGRKLGPGEGTVNSPIGGELRSIRRNGEIRVRTQIRRDLLRLGFVDPYPA